MYNRNRFLSNLISNRNSRAECPTAIDFSILILLCVFQKEKVMNHLESYMFLHAKCLPDTFYQFYSVDKQWHYKRIKHKRNYENSPTHIKNT